MADATYGPKIYRKDGGNSLKVAGGGHIDVESGGELRIAGTAITASAAELNITDGLTATAAELNAVADQSVNGGLLKVKQIAISTAPTGAEQDTGWDLPAKSIVYDVFVDVTAAEATGATKTLDVGLKAGEAGGDLDGFLNSIDVSTTGIKRGVPTITTGSNEVFFASTTRGALLASLTAGTDNAGDVGTYYEKPHICNGTAVSVSYDAESNDWVEFRGTINIVYVELA